MRKRIAALLLTVGSLLTVGVGSATARTTWVVDDDGMATPGHCSASAPAPSSINTAIAAAAAGDKIVVCPGTYNERVIVNKTLTLTGDTGSLSKNTCVNGTGGSDPAHDSVVNGGIDVKADGVTIQKFTVQNALYSPGVPAPGINVGSPAHNWVKLERNVIQMNLFGVYLNGDHDRVISNCIRNNNVAGPAAGSGIYSDQGLTNSTIDRNTFAGHENVATNLIGSLAPVYNVAVTKNNAINDSTFMVIGVHDVNITGNVSRHALFNGVQVDDPNSPTALSHDVVVASNDIRDCGFSGVQLFGTTDSQVHKNKVQGCADRGIGIRSGATGNTIDRNTLKSNGSYGIQAVSGTSGNRFERNSAKSNATLDCLDESVGTGTAGTANTWIKNTGPKAAPPPICD